MSDNKKNLNPKKLKIEYEQEGQEPQSLEFEVDNLYEGSIEEIKTIKTLFNKYSQIVLAIEDTTMFTLIMSEGEANFFQIEMEDNQQTTQFRQSMGILHESKAQYDEDPIFIHTSTDNREMACEILPGQPIFCKIQQIKQIDQEEYNRRTDIFKESLQQEPKHQPLNKVSKFEEEKLIELDKNSTDHYKGTDEENKMTKELFNQYSPKVVGIEEGDIYTRIEHENQSYYHKISIPDTPATEVWKMGIHALMNEKDDLYIYTSPNLKFAGFEFSPNEKMPKALVVTIIDAIRPIDQEEIRDRAKTWLEKTTPKLKDRKELEKLEDKIQEKSNQQNPHLN